MMTLVETVKKVEYFQVQSAYELEEIKKLLELGGYAISDCSMSEWSGTQYKITYTEPPQWGDV